MPRKLIFFFVLVALGSFAVFVALRLNSPAAGIETKGQDSSVVAAYLALATAVVSLLTAIVGLLKSFLPSRQKAGRDT
jgi:hypothetical protein